MSTSGPWIETVPWQNAKGTLEEAYGWQAKRLGQPAEFTMLGSLYPDLVMERLRLYKVVEATPSALTAFERLIAAYVTSALNHTPHCSSGLVHKLEDVEARADLLEQNPFVPAVDCQRGRTAGLNRRLCRQAHRVAGDNHTGRHRAPKARGP